MTFTQTCRPIFDEAVRDYHVLDNIDAPIKNPYPEGGIEHDLYLKCWIDAVQWHMEDIIRDPDIDPLEALALKRRIDRSNQDRTDLVERIDSYFLSLFSSVTPQPSATVNTETPAWAVDRLSILALKVWHMREQAERPDATEEHRGKCGKKLQVLLLQQCDLSDSIDALLEDLKEGRKRMKLYKQMKLYNDTDTNPVLYGKK